MKTKGLERRNELVSGRTLPLVSQLQPNRMNFRECYDVE